MQRNYLTNNGTSWILKHHNISYLYFVHTNYIVSTLQDTAKGEKNPINLETSFNHWKKKISQSTQTIWCSTARQYCRRRIYYYIIYIFIIFHRSTHGDRRYYSIRSVSIWYNTTLRWPNFYCEKIIHNNIYILLLFIRLIYTYVRNYMLPRALAIVLWWQTHTHTLRPNKIFNVHARRIFFIQRFIYIARSTVICIKSHKIFSGFSFVYT